ncbi:hypothetical protein [Streptosporangium sp. NPDC051022]|uniref:hypothetical protein n=1 Tax=Streptosporangium sp. NPDC051022 TaxID=3155752 RepID=UPI00341FA13E
MSNPDGVLAAINACLDDYTVSEDAMRWTVEEPAEPKALPLANLWMPQADPEAVRRAGEVMVAQFQAFMEAMRPVAEQMIRDATVAYEAIAKIIRTPEMRELLAARQLARRAMKTEYRRRTRRKNRR